jgi:COMPASS component SWD3
MNANNYSREYSITSNNESILSRHDTSFNNTTDYKGKGDYKLKDYGLDYKQESLQSEYEDDLMHSQLYENHEKLINTYNYSKIKPKLSQIYFFPKLIHTKTRPECFCVRYDSTDKYIAGGFSTGHIVIYDVSKGSYIKHMSLSEYPISTIRWKTGSQTSSNSRSILNAVHSDGKVSQWYVVNGKILYTFEEPGNFIMCLDYDSSGRNFATGGSDNTVRMYDDETKSLVYKVSNSFDYVSHSNRIFSICFGKQQANENLLVSGGWDNTIKFFDIRIKSIVNSILGPHINGDSIDLKNWDLLTGSHDIKDQVKIWDIRNFKCKETVSFEPNSKKDDLCVTGINTAQFSKNIDHFRDKNFDTFACGGQKRNQVRIFTNDHHLIDVESFDKEYRTKEEEIINDPEKDLTLDPEKYLQTEENGTNNIKPKELDKIVKKDPNFKSLPLIKIDNIRESIYTLDYANNSETLAYGSAFGCIYSLDLSRLKHK